jgi:hypothetical protein
MGCYLISNPCIVPCLMGLPDKLSYDGTRWPENPGLTAGAEAG